MEKNIEYNKILNPMYLLSIVFSVLFFAFLFAPTISYVANGVDGLASGYDIIAVCFSGSALGIYSIVGSAGAVLIVIGLLLFLAAVSSGITLILGILGFVKKFNTEKYISWLIIVNLVLFIAITLLIIVLSDLIVTQKVGLTSYAFTSLFVGYGQILFDILPVLYIVVHKMLVTEINFNKEKTVKSK